MFFTIHLRLISQRFNLLLWSTTVACAFFALPYIVSAADLVISPASGSFTVGQTFTATVRVVPGGASVNAVEAVLTFDPTKLSVVSVSKDGSIFSLWTTEPTFSNAAGTVTFGGGATTPFTATSNIINVTFRAVADGSGMVNFASGASVLAADGRGTDVFKKSTGATYTLAAAAAPTPTPTPTPTPAPTPADDANSDEAIIFGDAPRAPEIGSTVFLDSELWYKTKTGTFSWTLPFDVNAVAIAISTTPDNRPELDKANIIEPPVDEYSISPEIVTDGIQYVSVNYRNQVGWGAPVNRKLMIDTTPPEPFAIAVRAGTTPSAFPLLTFEAQDVTSGIQYYDMTVADKEPIRITPAEAKLGYLLRDLEDGTYTVKVVATDMAGNTRESSVAVLITAGWIKPAEVVEETSWFDYLTPLNLFIAFLIVFIILLSVYIWYTSKVLRQKEEKLRKETREIQDQMEKIFSALRDEIYDQINMITKRKRLSQSEKDAVEGLTQALEVSETLIEKEINDVKSILK